MARRQRRRRRGTAEYTAPKTKLPFPLNLIFNTKAFYMFFIVVMIASIAAVGLVPGGTGRERAEPPDLGEGAAVEPTPGGMTFEAPAKTIDTSRAYIATIRTNEGDITIDLDTAGAPQATNSFAFLAGSGFYKDALFYYVNEDYVAQAGDPGCRAEAETVCSGTGGPGYSLPLENGEAPRDQWAVVAPTLVDGSEDVSGSQFRVFLVNDQRPNVQGTVFGKVIEGQELLEGLNNLVPCDVVSTESCDSDLSGALVIEDVIVQPKVV